MFWAAEVLVCVAGSALWLVCLELVQGRLRCQIKELTADGLLPRISCSLPMFGVRSRIWKGEDGGWMNREEEQLGSLCNFSVTQDPFCK